MFWKNFRELSDLLQRVKRLEEEMRSFRLDWEEMYERYRKLAARSAKERGKMEELQAKTDHENGAAEQFTASPPFSALSPRQRMLTEQILRRRQAKLEG